MQHKILSLFVGSLLAICGVAFAADAPPADGNPPPVHVRQSDPGSYRMAHRQIGKFRARGMRRHLSPAIRASIRDINAISRLYRVSGKTNRLAGFYREVLGKTRNPILRNYVYARLARLQSAPTDTSAAIATLRQSLDENLALVRTRKQRRHD